MDQGDCCRGTKSTRESIKSDQRNTNPTSRATLRRSRRSCRRKTPKRERTMDRTKGIAVDVSVNECEEGRVWKEVVPTSGPSLTLLGNRNQMSQWGSPEDQSVISGMSRDIAW